tara:strand:+ start:512 stop:919 length:408 start_codon:yes stop_codon:yes gene_type:complete
MMNERNFVNDNEYDNEFNNIIKKYQCSLDFINIYFDNINYYFNVMFYGVTFGIMSFVFVYIIVPIFGAFMVLLLGNIIYEIINIIKNFKILIKNLITYCRQNYKRVFDSIVFVLVINIIFQIVYHVFVEHPCYNI